MSDYGDSLRQMARWVREELDGAGTRGGFDLGDVDTDELDAAAAEIDRLQQELSSLKEREKVLVGALRDSNDAIKEWVDGWGAPHWVRCPEDDTCQCPFVATVNRVINQADKALSPSPVVQEGRPDGRGRMAAALRECAEYFEPRQDIRDGENGQLPNEEMRLLTEIRQALGELPG